MVRSGQATGGAAVSSATAQPTRINAITLRQLSDDLQWQRPLLCRTQLLILVTAGHGVTEVDFHHLPCRPGALVRVRPGQALRSSVPPGLDGIAVRWTGGGDLPDPLGRSTPAPPWHWQLGGADGDPLVSGIRQLEVDCRRHAADEWGQLLLRHQLSVLLLRLALLPGAGPTTPDAEERTYHRFCQEVERRYRQSRRVEDYAAQLRCSVRTLTRACLAATGRSAKQVIDERVALQARRLLAATNEPVAQLGRDLGFPEPTNFGRFFAREVGLTPGAFRARAGQPLADPVVTSGPPVDPVVTPGPPAAPNG